MPSSPSAPSGLRSLGYDLKDRLVEQKQGASILTRHEYDADGRRTKKIGEEGIRQYVYDDTSLLAEYSSSGVEIAKYDYGADRLIRLTRADEGTRYMTFDGLGSVTGLTNPSGDVTATYHLDAWGNYRFTSELETSHNRFGFTGHYWDKEASLYYAKARYYDPFTARFTQADSFLGTIDDPPSLHRYQYAAANPTMFVDPDGNEVKAVGVDTRRITFDESGSPRVGAVQAVETEVVEVRAYSDRASAFAAQMDHQADATGQMIALGSLPSTAGGTLLIGGPTSVTGFMIGAAGSIAEQTALEKRGFGQIHYGRVQGQGLVGALLGRTLPSGLSSRVGWIAQGTRLAGYGGSAAAVGSGIGHIAEGVATDDWAMTAYGTFEAASGSAGIRSLLDLSLPELELPSSLSGLRDFALSEPYYKPLRWSTNANMFVNPAQAIGLRPPLRSAVNRGEGGHVLMDRLAGEAQGAISQAGRILKSGGYNTRWAQLYQALRGSGSRLEFLAERNALHQEAEAIMLQNKYVLDAIDSGNQIVFNRGSVFGIVGRRGGLTRPDVQIGLVDGRWGVLDWTTPGSGAKILKYQNARTPFLLNIFY